MLITIYKTKRCLYERNAYICIYKPSKMDLTKLKEIRIMRKMSLKDMSKSTGINRDRLSLIERGMVNPSFATVVAMADVLGAKIMILL